MSLNKSQIIGGYIKLNKNVKKGKFIQSNTFYVITSLRKDSRFLHDKFQAFYEHDIMMLARQGLIQFNQTLQTGKNKIDTLFLI